MTDAVETMAYSGQTPWHGLGAQVSNKLSPEEMLKAAGINWKVSKQKIQIADGQFKGKPVPGKFALVRDTDGRVLTTVGSTYKPVQNAEAMSFFRRFIEAGKMEMDTAGSLHNGQYIWGLAKIGASFKVGKGDTVEGNLLVASPHKIGKSLIIQFTGIRVVCWNTFQMALGASLKGKGKHFSMPHSMEFNDATKKRAEEALGIAKEQLAEIEQAVQHLAKKKAKPDMVREYFFEVLQWTEAERKAHDAEENKNPRAFERFSHALTAAPGQNLETAKGTWWGAFNAVTFVVDHQQGNSRDTGLKNAWFGSGQRTKRRALDLAIQYAK